MAEVHERLHGQPPDGAHRHEGRRSEELVVELDHDRPRKRDLRELRLPQVIEQALSGRGVCAQESADRVHAFSALRARVSACFRLPFGAEAAAALTLAVRGVRQTWGMPLGCRVVR